MPWERVLAIAAAVATVLYAAFDAGLGPADESPVGTSSALLALAGVFACGAWVMRVGGQPERVPLLVGLALGAGGYAVARLVAF
jgi:drug/metabolite transporter (DMT)-like permease